MENVNVGLQPAKALGQQYVRSSVIARRVAHCIHQRWPEGGQELWLMGADGEEPRRILASDSPDYQSIAWSPTGSVSPISVPGHVWEGRGHHRDLRSGGAARTLVLSDPRLWGENGISGIAWAPDGRIIYSIFSSDTESSLWARMGDPSTGTQSGDSTRLAGWKNFSAWSPQASADGKRLIVQRTHIENGIYIGDLAFGKKALLLTVSRWTIGTTPSGRGPATVKPFSSPPNETAVGRS